MNCMSNIYVYCHKMFLSWNRLASKCDARRNGTSVALWFAFCIKFALTDSAESEGMPSRKESFPRKDDKIHFNGRADFHLRNIERTSLLESNDSALTTVQLIISRITSRCAAHCRQLRSWNSNEFAHRIPFHSIRSRSRAEWRASGRERGYIEAFEVSGAFGIKPLVRSRARQVVIV